MFRLTAALLTLSLLLSTSRAAAPATQPSDPPAIPLWPNSDAAAAQSEEIVNRGKYVPDRSVRNVRYATLTPYLPDPSINTGAAIVICPGGGYGGLAIDKEGHYVARFLNSHGIAGFVLKYRMPRADEMKPADLPLPLQDAHQAIRTVRARAAEWKINPARVGILGFSAGGHLASTAATHFDPSTRPDFAVLIYPVITMKPPITHSGSRKNLLGNDPTPVLEQLYSNELQVTPQTPPTFLVHAKDDPVKVENSLLFHAALKKANIPSELLLFETGGHGFGLGVRGGDPATWPPRCLTWLHAQGLLTPKK